MRRRRRSRRRSSRQHWDSEVLQCIERRWGRSWSRGIELVVGNLKKTPVVFTTMSMFPAGENHRTAVFLIAFDYRRVSHIRHPKFSQKCMGELGGSSSPERGILSAGWGFITSDEIMQTFGKVQQFFVSFLGEMLPSNMVNR